MWVWDGSWGAELIIRKMLINSAAMKIAMMTIDNNNQY